MSPNSIVGFLVAPAHILSLNESFGDGLSPGKSKHIFCAPLDRSGKHQQMSRQVKRGNHRP